jgi:hypothetical protein
MWTVDSDLKNAQGKITVIYLLHRRRWSLASEGVAVLLLLALGLLLCSDTANRTRRAGLDRTLPCRKRRGDTATPAGCRLPVPPPLQIPSARLLCSRSGLRCCGAHARQSASTQPHGGRCAAREGRAQRAHHWDTGAPSAVMAACCVPLRRCCCAASGGPGTFLELSVLRSLWRCAQGTGKTTLSAEVARRCVAKLFLKCSACSSYRADA